MSRVANKAQGVALGLTMVEKILARTSGRSQVRAGDNIEAKPDFVVAYDFPGYTDVIFQQMKNDFGIDKVAEPKRFALFIDHMVPAITPQEEDLHQLLESTETNSDTSFGYPELFANAMDAFLSPKAIDWGESQSLQV